MAVTSNSNDTGIDLPTNEFDEPTFIGSDILTGDKDLTPKQRSILLAANAFIGADDVTFSKIARNAGVSAQYVRYVLVQFIDRDLLPCSHPIIEKCTSVKEYDDLTETQRAIVNEKIVNPDSTNESIAEHADCSPQHVYETLVIYGDIVEQRLEEICE